MEKVRTLTEIYNMPICGYVGAEDMINRVDLGYRMSDLFIYLFIYFCFFPQIFVDLPWKVFVNLTSLPFIIVVASGDVTTISYGIFTEVRCLLKSFLS